MVPPLKPALVDECHDAVRSFLREVTTGPPGEDRTIFFPLDPDLTRAFTRTSAPGQRPVRYEFRYVGGTPKTRLLFTLASLLELYGDRVIACPRPGCGRIFWAHHKQEYCTTACNQRARNDRKPKKESRG